MVSELRILERLRRWAEQPPARGQRLPSQLVHKWRAENVFVARLERLAADEPSSGDISDVHVAELAIDPSHPFFFEHPLDHVPGMMLLEAGRQVATAIAHLSYDVPHGCQFLLNDLNARFLAMVELDLPTFVVARVTNKRFRRGILVEANFSGEFLQAQTVIGEMGGRLGIIGVAQALATGG